MPLTCSCDDPAWFFAPPGDDDFDLPLATKRGRRCPSCKTWVRVGEPATRFQRWRYASGHVEERIYGEWGEVPMPDLYLCERCAELYSNLEALGFCVGPDENLLETTREYAEVYR